MIVNGFADRLHTETGCYLCGSYNGDDEKTVIYPAKKDGEAYGLPGESVWVIDYMARTDGTYNVEGNGHFADAKQAAKDIASWVKRHAGQTLVHQEYGSGNGCTVAKIAETG